MRQQLVALGLGLMVGSNLVSAQPPSQLPQTPFVPRIPGNPPPPPASGAASGSLLAPSQMQPPTLSPQSLAPRAPGPLGPVPPPPPGSYAPSAHPTPPAPLPPGLVAELPLPYPEQKLEVSARDIQVRKVYGGWEVWAGHKQLRSFGDNETVARDVARVVRDLRPTEWITIGGPKPVIEYGLTNGRPAVAGVAPTGDGKPAAGTQTDEVTHASGFGPGIAGVGPKFVQSIDLRTARAEAIRGAWCIHDDDNILCNFGPDRASAEQAIAVIRKYGFNRVGMVGTQNQPAMRYLYVSLEPDQPKALNGGASLNPQIEALTRTGIPVPGSGYVGEMVKIDPRKVEAQKLGAEWVVASGSEILGHFGPTEWAAREAARTVRDAHFTEFCKLGGTSDLTFFLHDGKPPARAPLSAQGRAFDPASLKAQQINGKWSVSEGNRFLFAVSGQPEGDTVVRVLKAYGFNQLAHVTAGGPKGGITFLVKNR